MSLNPNYEEMEKSIQNFIESDVGKKYFEKMRIELEIKRGRYVRFEKWLENNDFEKLMQRLISEMVTNGRTNAIKNIMNHIQTTNWVF